MKPLNFVIPMGGTSSRFNNAGYNVPKYMLDAKGKTLFEHSVESFKDYFDNGNFLFIVLQTEGIRQFLFEKIKIMGIVNYEIVFLDNPTKGQAETVAIGIERSQILNDGGLIIFNIDTFRNGYSFPKSLEKSDGYLEVFEGYGENWSYAEPINENSTLVIRTAEKKRISKFCSTGLYYFSSQSIFLEAYDTSKFDGYENQKELYIAPMYNNLISKNYKIHYNLIESSEVIFCGTPSEYENYISLLE